MDAREQVLRRLTSEPAELPEPRAWWSGEADEAAFRAAVEGVAGRVVSAAELASIPGRRWCVDPDLGPLPAECGEFEPTSVWEADVGVTRADLGIVETGSIVLAVAEGRRRLASLAPAIHCAFLRRDRIVGSLAEALSRFTTGGFTVVTGPSRTADIEGVLVRPAHGPRELWVVLVDASPDLGPTDNPWKEDSGHGRDAR